MTDIAHLKTSIVAAASIISLLFIILKGLAKDFELVALMWIRTLRRIKEERSKPIRQVPSQPSRLVKRIHSKRE